MFAVPSRGLCNRNVHEKDRGTSASFDPAARVRLLLLAADSRLSAQTHEEYDRARQRMVSEFLEKRRDQEPARAGGDAARSPA